MSSGIANTDEYAPQQFLHLVTSLAAISNSKWDRSDHFGRLKESTQGISKKTVRFLDLSAFVRRVS